MNCHRARWCHRTFITAFMGISALSAAEAAMSCTWSQRKKKYIFSFHYSRRIWRSDLAWFSSGLVLPSLHQTPDKHSTPLCCFVFDCEHRWLGSFRGLLDAVSSLSFTRAWGEGSPVALSLFSMQRVTLGSGGKNGKLKLTLLETYWEGFNRGQWT